MIGDFGVPIAILIMVLVDNSLDDAHTQVKLDESWMFFLLASCLRYHVKGTK